MRGRNCLQCNIVEDAFCEFARSDAKKSRLATVGGDGPLGVSRRVYLVISTSFFRSGRRRCTNRVQAHRRLRTTGPSCIA